MSDISIKGVDVSKCDGCGACTEVCCLDNYVMTDHKGRIVARFNAKVCLHCGKCVINCERSAIMLSSKAGKIVKIGKSCDACGKCVMVCKEKNLEVVEHDGEISVKCGNKCSGDHYCLFVCDKQAIIFETKCKRSSDTEA